MEREGVQETLRLMRSIRSLAYNRELQPQVEKRIERAEASIRGYLLKQSLMTTQIGPYEVKLDEEGDISLTRRPVDDDWQQLSLPRAVAPMSPHTQDNYNGRKGTT